MKKTRYFHLNAGCGKIYKKGFINIDAFDTEVADIRCSVTSLPFKSGKFKNIECHHVLEHLGYIGAIYCLHEFFRILKTGGKIEIETPDIQSSFKKFLKYKSQASRSLILSWIFGISSPGLSHKILFPKLLLKKMLKNTGFTNIRFYKTRPHPLMEGISVVARKSKSKTAEIIATLHHLFIETGISDLNDHIGSLEIETKFFIRVNDFYQKKKDRKNIIMRNIVFSPSGVIQWCRAEEMVKGKINPLLKEGEKLSNILLKISFLSRLISLFEQKMDFPDAGGDLYELVFLKGFQIISILWGKTEKEIILTIEKELPLSKNIYNTHVFSKHFAEKLVKSLEAKGLKLFALEKYDEASAFLRKAINSGMCEYPALKAYASLYELAGKHKEAIFLYRNILKHPIPLEIKNQIRKSIKIK